MIARLAIRFALALLAALLIAQPALRGQIPPDAGAAAYAADLAARRAQAMSALGPDTVLVAWSAPARVYSADIDYPYRQDSTLLYLSGITQDRVILVLVPGARTMREWLFVPASDARSELWLGHSMTTAEAAAASGIKNVIPERGTEAFDAFITGLLQGNVNASLLTDPAEFSAFSAALAADRASLALAEPLPDPAKLAAGSDTTEHVVWARRIAAASTGLSVTSAAAALSRQRQIKTTYEQAVLAHGAEISAEAHVEAMRLTRPGRWEYEIKAAIEYQFLRHGELSWGYPSIVGSGPNATSLHYLAGTRQLEAGDLLLVDAAGNYQGLTADITRTYPVSGRFSPAQRKLYDLVLEAQEAGIATARPGARPEDVTAAIRAVFRRGLPALGLIDPALDTPIDDQVGLWFPHLPIHGIGVDVHDPLGTLVPGAAFVIEPGLYVRPDAFDRLERTPATERLAKTLAPALAAYRNLGIRIEDSFLMTPTGPRMLSSAAPRAARDIERVVNHPNHPR